MNKSAPRFENKTKKQGAPKPKTGAPKFKQTAAPKSKQTATPKPKRAAASKSSKPSAGFNYNNAEKKNKNFMYANLEKSNCYKCDFEASNFDYASFRGAHFKSSNFNKCSFKWAEFVGTNFKNSSMRSAKFENAVFDSVKLEGVSFKGAIFNNTIFVNTDMSQAQDINLESAGLKILDEMPKLEISEELNKTTLDAIANPFIKKSRVLDTRDGSINTLSLSILLGIFEEDELIRGLKEFTETISREFHTLSYIIKFIENFKKENA